MHDTYITVYDTGGRTRYVPSLLYVLRGGIVIRTHDVRKNPYITLFLHAWLGPDYCVPP